MSKNRSFLTNIGGILKLEDLFLSLLIKYRKARKLKYKEYKKKFFNQLDLSRDSDPKSYWSLLEKLNPRGGMV